MEINESVTSDNSVERLSVDINNFCKNYILISSEHMSWLMRF